MTPLIICKHREYECDRAHQIANGGHYFKCPFRNTSTESAERVCKFFEPLNDVVYRIVSKSDGTILAAFLLSETTTPFEDATELAEQLQNVEIIEVK